jgi:cyclohexyl-isocyanide hydratase
MHWGAAGLLRGYKAATHWTAMEALRPFGAEPTDKRVVVDRNRITGGGVTAGMDFALTIVALLHGDAVAQSMQLAMEYDPEPPFQSGSPKMAPPAIVERVRAGAAALTADRIAIAERVARKNGWPSEP